jgi:hypothetical protein
VKARTNFRILYQLLIVFGAICVVLFCVISGYAYYKLKLPNPKDASLIAKRELTKNSIYAEFKKLNDITGHSYGTAVVNHCHNSNSLFNGGFGNKCSVRVTNFYGLDGDYNQQTATVYDQLLAAGWKRSQNSDGPTSARLEKNNQRMQARIAEAPLGSYAFDDIQLIEEETYGKVIFEDKQLQDPIIFKKIIKDHKIVLVISIEETYFESYFLH